MALNAERIEKNPGRRAPCKLMANSFCARSESKPIRQVTTCQTADQFFNLSKDYTMIIHGLLPVGDEMLDVYHSFVTSVGELSCRTNIFVAICTTAESGIHLSSTEKDSSRWEIACCAWMDSVMYTVSLSLTRLPRGKYLGQLKDELDGGPIIDYIGLGPNDYVYLTRSGKHCHKAREFSQNYRNNDVINFDTKKTLLHDELSDPSPIARTLVVRLFMTPTKSCGTSRPRLSILYRRPRS